MIANFLLHVQFSFFSAMSLSTPLGSSNLSLTPLLNNISHLNSPFVKQYCLSELAVISTFWLIEYQR